MEKENRVAPKNGFEIIKGLATIVGLTLIMHYFLSYKWLYNFFKYYHLEMMPVISWDDLRFTFGDMNSTILIPAFYGFIWIAVIRLIASNKLYFNFGQATKKGAEKIKEGMETLKEELQKPNSFGLILIIVFLTLLFCFIIYLSLPDESTISFETGLYLLLLLLFLPFGYLILSEKRSVVLGFYIFFIFCWANYLLNGFNNEFKLILNKNILF